MNWTQNASQRPAQTGLWLGGSSDPVPAVLGGLLAVVDEGVWGVAIDGRGQRPEGGLEDPGRHMTHKKRDGRGGVDRSIERNACVPPGCTRGCTQTEKRSLFDAPWKKPLSAQLGYIGGQKRMSTEVSPWGTVVVLKHPGRHAQTAENIGPEYGPN